MGSTGGRGLQRNVGRIHHVHKPQLYGGYSQPTVELFLIKHCDMTKPLHGLGEPSEWLKRWRHLLSPNSCVLDLASGAGRHTRYLLALGHAVTAVDQDSAALAYLGDTNASCVQADLEGEAWPFANEQFDAVVMTNYLWRPLFPALIASLKPGGFVLFETFAMGQETIGKPSRPAFLLAPGEALSLCEGLHVVAFEHGFVPATPNTPPRFVQRIVAAKPQAPDQSPVRHNLHA